MRTLCDVALVACPTGPSSTVADTAGRPISRPSLGAAAFSVSSTFTLAQAEHVIGDAGSRVLIIEPANLEQALEIRQRGLTALEWIVLVEGEHELALTWEELAAAAPPDFELGARAYPNDLVTLIYAGGTGGLPIGVELTHINVAAQIEALTEALGLSDGLRVISWLPMAHIPERCARTIVRWPAAGRSRGAAVGRAGRDARRARRPGTVPG